MLVVLAQQQEVTLDFRPVTEQEAAYLGRSTFTVMV